MDAVDKAVEDAIKVKNNDFGEVSKDVAQLMKDDKTAGQQKTDDDFHRLNKELHDKRILHNCDIVGADDKNHLVTKSGSEDAVQQDASKFNDKKAHGDGFFGLVDSVKDFVDHPVDTVVDAVTHPLETAKTIANVGTAPLAIIDKVAGTHTSKVVEELEKGAIDEAKHHPLRLIGEAAGAAAATAGAVALLPEMAGTAGIAATAALSSALFTSGFEVWKNHSQIWNNIEKTPGKIWNDISANFDKNWKEDKPMVDKLTGGLKDSILDGVKDGLNNVVAENAKIVGKGAWYDFKATLGSAKGWFSNAGTIAAPGKNPAEVQDKAEAGLHQAGAALADIKVGIAASAGAGFGAKAAHLEGAIPNSKLVPDSIKAKLPGIEKEMEKRLPKIPPVPKAVPEVPKSVPSSAEAPAEVPTPAGSKTAPPAANPDDDSHTKKK